MVRSTMVGLLMLPGLAASLALAQTETPESAAPAKYKVAFWYERGRPAQTFHSQVYDLGKGQYDPGAVGRWLALIDARFPGTVAYVRDLSVPREPGALSEAIERERQAIGRLQPAGAGGGRPAATGDEAPMPAQPSPRQERRPREVTNYIPMPNYGQLMHPSISGYPPGGRPPARFSVGAPPGGSMRYGSAPPNPAYPFPYPYPRPHP